MLDPNTPFLELSPLAAHELYGSEHIPGAGMITGVGQISGQQCVVVVNDATVKGGSYYPLTVCNWRNEGLLYHISFRLGEEASKSTRNRKREWPAMCLSR